MSLVKPTAQPMLSTSPPSMRVLLFGSAGMLGHDLAATAPSAVSLVPFRRQDLDITDITRVRSVIRDLSPDAVVNAAAYTAVDRAETEGDQADLVNGTAVGAIGVSARAVGARVVHFSTDYVFDGTSKVPYSEDAPTNPLNRYGASKLAGEVALHQSGAKHLIIRTQWLFGVHGRSFPGTMIARAQSRSPTRVVDDQVGRLTYTGDLAAVAWRLLQLETSGTIHVANSGTATWFAVAREIFSRLHASALLAPCSTKEFPTVAARPAYSVLDTSRVESLLPALPPWPEALGRFMKDVSPPTSA